ncbi:hypothetical protein TUMSATVNIG3_23740 [Vibrio nigripulchritudo]|nr:hypothetical protein TUMSATVNIG3_23740 [Vibrio nigripulchritudo]
MKPRSIIEFRIGSCVRSQFMKVRAISDRAEKKKLSERDGIDGWLFYRNIYYPYVDPFVF